MSEHSPCPIWKTPAIEERTGDGETVDSPRAGGRYSITGRAVEILRIWDESLKSRLTSWLIEQRRLGVDCPNDLVAIVDAAVSDVNVQISMSLITRIVARVSAQLPQRGW